MIKQYSKYLPLVLVIFHVIGLGLFLIEKEASPLTYLNLTLSAILVLLATNDGKRALVPFVGIMFGGFIIELIGIQTGILFGEYSYLTPMGPQIIGTPVLIGATWYGVVSGAAAILQQSTMNIGFKALLIGLICSVLDILIEIVAIDYGMWFWHFHEVPAFNYLCWFVFSSLFGWLYLSFCKEKNNTARWLIIIWICFFTILSIFSRCIW